jgi:enediyne biosynthesis protein E4
MYYPIQLTTALSFVRTSIRRSPWRRAFLLIPLACALASFALSPTARALDPPPDGGDPIQNTAGGDDTLFNLTTDTGNTAIVFDAVSSTTTGSFNTATGHSALLNNTPARDDTGNGFAAFLGNSTGFITARAQAGTASATQFPRVPGTLTFTDVSVEAGFFGNNSSWAAAWGDYDNDGNVDVMTLGHVQGITNSISQLWHNNGDETFTDVTIQAGLNPHNGDAHGAGWGDFDSDGYLDLYIAKGTPKADPNNYNELWRNNGDGTFINIASSSRVTGRSHRTRGAYAVDYDRDSDLDIFSTSFDTPNLLFRNDGGLQFIDVAEEAGLQRNDIENRTAAWADFDGDGLMDVLITKSSALFRNRGDGTFLDVTTAAGITQSVDAQSGAWGDYDNDGDLDLYITMGESNGTPIQGILYRNNGDGTFTDVTAASGAVNTVGALGVTWGDYDNDGYLDLYIVNTETGLTEPNRLFRNNGDGTFTDVASTAGVGGKTGQGRGSDATFADYNNDGFLDLFVCNGAGNTVGPYLLYRNNGNSNEWLKVVLIGQQSNRSGIGAKILLKAGGGRQFREYTGQHYMSQNHIPVHFGLGQATIIDSLTIRWPGGITQILHNIAVNQTLTITESGAQQR